MNGWCGCRECDTAGSDGLLNNIVDGFMDHALGNISAAQKEEFAGDLKREHAKTTIKAKKVALKRHNKRIRDILSGELVVGVNSDDPPQTPISMQGVDEFESSVIIEEWNLGFDYHPANPMFTYLSDWLRDIFNGDFGRFLKHIDGLSVDEIGRKLEQRESLQRCSAIFHVVLGAKALYGSQISTGHIKILEKILEYGARMDVHDVKGMTPLYYSVCQDSRDKDNLNRTIMTMARMLLEKGANPNLRNRFGGVPLIQCMKETGEEAAQLLIDFGADPTIETYDSISPMEISMQYPAIEAIFTTSFKEVVKKERKAAKENADFKKCEACKSLAGKRCSGCYMAWYCCGECQREDWPNHKESCKAIKKEYLEVKDLYNSWSALQTNSYQVVRIKISYVESVLHINNKDNTISGPMETGSLPAGPILHTVIKKWGFKGTQGYFSSFMKKGVLYVHPNILPPETW